MSDLLAVVPGRVTALTSTAAFVEFPSPLPAAGTTLWHERGVLEVLGPHNPTEVRAVVRAGHSPALHAQTTARQDPPTHPTLPLPLPLSLERAPSPLPTPGAVLPTGHPGLDLWAPLRAGAGLALNSEDLESLQVVGWSVAQRVAALEGWEALIIGASPRPAWSASLPAARHLHAAPDAHLGAVSLLLRAAQAEVEAARAAGRRLLVVLDHPAALVSAWRQVDAPRASSAHASARWDRFLVQLLGGSERVTILALLWEDPTSPPLPGAGGELSGEELGSVARVEPGGALELGRTRTLWLESEVVGERRREVGDAARAALTASGAVGDHARIFGVEELEEAAAASLSRSEGLSRLLLSAPARRWGLEEGLSAAEALVSGEA